MGPWLRRDQQTIPQVPLPPGLQALPEKVGLGWVPGGSKYLLRRYDEVGVAFTSFRSFLSALRSSPSAVSAPSNLRRSPRRGAGAAPDGPVAEPLAQSLPDRLSGAARVCSRTRVDQGGEGDERHQLLGWKVMRGNRFQDLPSLVVYGHPFTPLRGYLLNTFWKVLIERQP